MDDASKSLWAKVCETVTRLGGPRTRTRTFAAAVPVSTIDLHEMTVQEAYLLTIDFLRTTSLREVTIITGKSGVIRREFLDWLTQARNVRSYSELSGGGAFLVKLRNV